MRFRRRLPVVLALAGAVAVLVGVQQGLVHVAPGYEGTITTGWDGPINHEERLLVGLGALGVVGSALATRWRRLAVVPVVAGAVVAGYALRAAFHYAMDPGLYVEVAVDGGASIRFVLGAEPFLLVGGAVLLVVAGVRGWRAGSDRSDADERRTAPSTT